MVKKMEMKRMEISMRIYNKYNVEERPNIEGLADGINSPDI